MIQTDRRDRSGRRWGDNRPQLAWGVALCFLAVGLLLGWGLGEVL